MATRTTAKASKTKPKTTTRRKATPKYIRNLRNTEVGLRLSHQDSKTRFTLKPRGQRGDITGPITKEDQNDPIFVSNLEIGLFEIISETDRNEIIKKQAKNASQFHPARFEIRNAGGDAYKGDFVKVVNEEENSTTVAHISGEELHRAQQTDEVIRATLAQEGLASGIPGLNVVIEEPKKG